MINKNKDYQKNKEKIFKYEKEALTTSNFLEWGLHPNFQKKKIIRFFIRNINEHKLIDYIDLNLKIGKVNSPETTNPIAIMSNKVLKQTIDKSLKKGQLKIAEISDLKQLLGKEIIIKIRSDYQYDYRDSIMNNYSSPYIKIEYWIAIIKSCDKEKNSISLIRKKIISSRNSSIHSDDINIITGTICLNKMNNRIYYFGNILSKSQMNKIKKIERFGQYLDKEIWQSLMNFLNINRWIFIIKERLFEKKDNQKGINLDLIIQNHQNIEPLSVDLKEYDILAKTKGNYFRSKFKPISIALPENTLLYLSHIKYSLKERIKSLFSKDKLTQFKWEFSGFKLIHEKEIEIQNKDSF